MRIYWRIKCMAVLSIIIRFHLCGDVRFRTQLCFKCCAEVCSADRGDFDRCAGGGRSGRGSNQEYARGEYKNAITSVVFFRIRFERTKSVVKYRYTIIYLNENFSPVQHFYATNPTGR